MDVMSLHMFYDRQDWNVCCCQFVGIYARDYKKAQLKRWAHVEMRFDTTSILEMG